MKRFKPKENELIVFNHESDAALFRVRKVEGRTLTIVDRAIEHLNPHEQFVDVSLAMPPSVIQLKQLED